MAWRWTGCPGICTGPTPAATLLRWHVWTEAAAKCWSTTAWMSQEPSQSSQAKGEQKIHRVTSSLPKSPKIFKSIPCGSDSSDLLLFLQLPVLDRLGEHRQDRALPPGRVGAEGPHQHRPGLAQRTHTGLRHPQVSVRVAPSPSRVQLQVTPGFVS